ncbi:hypothetical protein DS745_06955 [Anaerobacillus alkaliphilus]|uniref:Uncharacterized protein n=1 Tax=Anaerobacillus alkaliphilus TaxID=1548597 RepID=A0A4Q0VVM2_9BACI|nr:hypothetical protein [Anaerobacillus alkaliphilus]RXJ02435.1 hypothetical protein DS745_06955 [Anaerobacillus alkaliphilus]
MAKKIRYPLSKIGVFGISQLKEQNPYMIAWWSAVFPGFGHYLLSQYTRAVLLTLTEVVINTLARINEAMVYSFCGNFEMAKNVLEPRWTLGYLLIYLITIADSFRVALYQKKLTHLAKLEKSPIQNMEIFSTEILYLQKQSPVMGPLYSFFFPGLGQLYQQRYGLAFYAIFWWWFYLTFSRLHESFLYLVLGRLEQSITVLHPHWLLFMPSVMGGAIYHAYRTTIEHNELYRLEQRQHLSSRYQNFTFRISR